ncbi:hypothetical protein Ocin01_13975 [Orchesella cincta]|uniref:Uncharacterized protein n=1 Tax=Orchesella cincta TaxID=48709 RepID=A0A1D2MI73_ORCCI|nr:hypothetical protein Ocin01_13975 [Orchesella cincta]
MDRKVIINYCVIITLCVAVFVLGTMIVKNEKENAKNAAQNKRTNLTNASSSDPLFMSDPKGDVNNDTKESNMWSFFFQHLSDLLSNILDSLTSKRGHKTLEKYVL